MGTFKAIVAMSSNRVIGCHNTIPWHLPEDVKWFKQTTLGHILVMGRKTFESIGRPLPGRETLVLSRNAPSIAGVRVIDRLDPADWVEEPRDIFLCGGSEIYKQYLPLCEDLFLTLVHREVKGDAFFPPFESLFRLEKTLAETPDFSIQHWIRHPDRIRS